MSNQPISQPVWSASPAHRRFIPAYLLWFSILFVFFVLTFRRVIPELVGAILLGLTCLRLIRIYLFARSTRYALYPTRIEIEAGIISTTRHVIDIRDVKDIYLKRGILDGFLSVTNVTILTKNKAHPEFYIQGVLDGTIFVSSVAELRSMTPTQRRKYQT